MTVFPHFWSNYIIVLWGLSSHLKKKSSLIMTDALMNNSDLSENPFDRFTEKNNLESSQIGHYNEKIYYTQYQDITDKTFRS